MAKMNVTGSTIPYQLRPLKAIERNIFIELLKRLDSSNDFDLKEYRYVGFGAAFLEDFKQLHLALHISEMDCIEIDYFAHTRQLFNNPYHFVTLYNQSSTKYINENLKSDLGQIIWLDYAAPGDLAQQLLDIEILCSKLSPFDIVKFTFNASLNSFIMSHGIKKESTKIPGAKEFCLPIDTELIWEYLKNHVSYRNYLPDISTHKDIKDFDCFVRSMCARAIKRGLSRKLDFLHFAAFTYADGQKMTTITGMIVKDGDSDKILTDTKVTSWPFYIAIGESELVKANEITAPVMTASERLEIDRRLSNASESNVAESLDFRYGTNDDEHRVLIEGYRKFYRYLPYYGKVIY